MTTVLPKNDIVQAMISSAQEFDTPVSDKVVRAINATLPADFQRWVYLTFEEVLGHTPQNQEWLDFLSWVVITKNPWTPDPVKITSMRRLRVLEFTDALKAIYKNEFDGTQYTMEEVAKIAELADYYNLFGLDRKEFNEVVLTIAQQEQIPIFGIMLSLCWYQASVREISTNETRNALQSWIQYYNRDTQQFKQIELF